MQHSQTNPLVLIDGNCQGQALAAILRHSGLADAYAVGGDIGFVPAYLGRACQYIAEAAAEQMITEARRQGRRVIQGTQSVPTADGAVLSYSGDVDMVLRYPQLQFYAQSPGEFAAHYGREESPARLLPFYLSTVKVCQERAASPTDFVEIMRTTGLETPLFHSALHPGGFLTARLVSDFASCLPGSDPDTIERITRQIAAGEGMNFISCHPVPSERQAEFGANWQYPYTFYADLLTRAGQGDWQWILANAEKAEDLFPNDTQTWNVISLAAMATEDDALATAAMDRLLILSPGFNEYWRRAFAVCQRRGDTGFSDLVSRARAFFGDQRQGRSVLTRALCERGRWAEAEGLARAYLDQTPERYEGMIPLLTVLVRSGQLESARELAMAAAHNCPPRRLGELKHCLSEVPGIDWTSVTTPHAADAPQPAHNQV